MSVRSRSAPADDRPRTELGWFLEQVRLAIVSPRVFARALAREHFGLAGVVVALAAGASLSLALDLLVIASRELDPLPFGPRLVTDAGFLSVRMAVTAALLGLVASGLLRVLRRPDAPSLDQLVTAVAFALAPLVLAFPTALLAATAPLLGPVAAVVGLLLAARVVYGLALNVRALLPLTAAVLTIAALLAAGSFALGDEIARARFITYGHLPQLAPTLAAEPARGNAYSRAGVALTLPERWRQVTSTTAGELARFETDTDVLTVTRARGGAFLTPGDLADEIARSEVRGMAEEVTRRDIVRIGDLVVVDDRHVGRYEGRRIALRQFTTVRGTQAYALVFRSIDPADPERSFAEDASIAATWRVGVAP